MLYLANRPHAALLTLSLAALLGLALAPPAAALPAAGWWRFDIPATHSYFFRYVPQSLDPTRPVPVVLFFHGSGSAPYPYEQFVTTAAERAGCVVALPKSASDLGWGAAGDEQTVSETLRLLRAEMPVDPARIAVAGHSAGGAYAYLLAYTARSGYSAVFSLAAPFYPVSQVADPTYKAPIRMFYGTADPNYLGGSYAALKQQWTALGVPWEEDIEPGLGHGDLPDAAMEAGFLFLTSHSYPVATPACAPDPTTLCLAGGRYRVTVVWRDFTGRTGVGSTVAAGTAADDSGLFWFFAPENWELLVKVLDGCALGGHHWVFAAATTNVEYTLTVTDTATRQSAVYHNTLGTSSPAITDTAALGCP